MNVKVTLYNQHFCLIAFFMILGLAGAVAQPSIVVTTLTGSVYRFETTNLETDDLVFYRFSDGYEMTAMCTGLNPTAAVQRKFKIADSKVSGFVAKKNGGVGLAKSDINNPDCPTCPVPSVGLPSGEYIRLRTTSWAPYVDPLVPAVLTDDKSSPTCVTPNIPWYIVPVTIKAPSANAYSIITVPSGMTVVGAFVKNIWVPVNVSSLPFPVADNDVQSFLYSSGGSFRINLTSTFSNEFNIYLLVSSVTAEGTLSTFCSQMYNSSAQPVGAFACSRYLTQHFPHDPNTLTAYKNSICWLTPNKPQLTYRIDFQNLGAADVQNVNVTVMPSQVAVEAFTVSNITSSHTVTSFYENPGSVQFQLTNINMPGLNQLPQPALDLTKGWVEFSFDANPCLSGGTFNTSGLVHFNNIQPVFNELTPTNQTTQFITYDASCPPDPACEQKIRSEMIAETPSSADIVAKCYPTLFNDNLIVEIPASQENSNMTLLMSDLTGMICLKKSYRTSPNEPVMDDLDTSTLPGGMYLVQIQRGSRLEKFKVIKI